MRKIRRLALGCLAVVLLASIAVNVALATPLADYLMNLQPDLVRIHYTRAYSPWPFHVVVDGFTLSVQDPNVQVFVSADHVTGDIVPLTLLSYRFLAKHVKGEGVVFRIRGRTKPGDGMVLTDLPPIPGYDDPASDGSPLPLHPIAVELLDLNVRDLREVWVNQYHVEGAFDLNGGFYYKPFELLRIDETHFTRGAGSLSLGHQPLATIEGLLVNASLEQTSLVNAGPTVLNNLTTFVSLEAQLHDATLINPYLRAVGNVRLEEGGGRLSLNAAVEKGVLREESVASLDTSRVVVHLPKFDIAGKGSLRWRVHDQESWFNVQVPEFSFSQHSDNKPVLKGGSFRLLAGSSSQLSSFADVKIELKLEKAHANDLSFLDPLIPDGTGVRIVSGEGTVNGALSMGAKSRIAHGTLDIEGQRLVIRNRAATLTGHAKIHGEVVAFNLDTGEFNLSGSNLLLNDVSVVTGTSVANGFWLTFLADPCLYTPQKDLKWAANLGLTFQNLQPVLAIVSANVPLPDILKPFADEPGVKASANFSVRADSVSLTQLRLDSPRIQVMGEVRLLEEKTKTPPPRLLPWGAVLVKVRNLAVGIDLQGTEVKPMLIEPDRWFTDWRAKHQAANQPSVTDPNHAP